MKGYTKSSDPNFLTSRIKVSKSGCWEWVGYINEKGYGVLTLSGKNWRAHRYVYQLYHKLDSKLSLDHLCLNKRCVNPDHLEQVTRSENSLRCSYNPPGINRQKTKCPKGHSYSGSNLYILKSRNYRYCRKCIAINNKKYKLKQKELQNVN